ncbi:hypothetical protein KW801_04065 [Candidatus Saccharibacteria bacterium]|nr:hypothetical protein [Candidatus Saccharibacteria bacterium]
MMAGTLQESEVMQVQVLTTPSGSNIEYRLVLPMPLEELGISVEAKRVELLDLRITPLHVFRQLAYELPRNGPREETYDILADFVRQRLGRPLLILQFDHICAHCGCDHSYTSYGTDLEEG